VLHGGCGMRVTTNKKKHVLTELVGTTVGLDILPSVSDDDTTMDSAERSSNSYIDMTHKMDSLLSMMKNLMMVNQDLSSRMVSLEYDMIAQSKARNESIKLSSSKISHINDPHLESSKGEYK